MNRVLLLLTILTAAQPTPEFEQLERAWNQAHLRGDVDLLTQLMAEDIVIQVPGMEKMTRAQALGVFASGRMKFTRYDTSRLDYNTGDLTAVVTGRVVRTRVLGGKEITDDWLFRKEYGKRDGRWVVTAWYAYEHPVQGGTRLALR